MRIKFNLYERIAGLFVLGALVGTLMIFASVAVKKGWFTSKRTFYSYFESAEGLYSGTPVQVSGLRVGSLEEIELIGMNKVKVRLEIIERFADRLREDSYIHQIRPFIIGEKVLEISMGTESKPVLAAGAEIPTQETFDVMTILSGRKMGSFLGSISGLVDNLRTLVEAFGNPERSKSLIVMFDRLAPLMVEITKLTKEATGLTQSLNRSGNVEALLVNLVSLTQEVNKVLPPMLKEAPELAQQIPKLIQNLAQLTEEFKKLTPALVEVAPQLPKASFRAIEAVDELVVVLKAMQKSFLLSGKVEEVRAAEEKASAEKPETQREPAQKLLEKGN